MSRAAIVACESAIAILERGGAVGTDHLVVLCAAVGESTEWLRRHNRSGFRPVAQDVPRVIDCLRDYLEDRRIECAADRTRP